MTTTKTITLSDGRQAAITGTDPTSAVGASLSVQILDATGHALGAAHLLTQAHGIDGTNSLATSFDPSAFVATALTNGGFEVAVNESRSDSQGFVTHALAGFGVDASGAITGGGNAALSLGQSNFALSLDTFNSLGKIALGTQIQPRLVELDGGRFAVTYNFNDATGAPTAHVALGNLNGVYADVAVRTQPDEITHANGDISLTWTQAGVTTREVLGEDGRVLMAKGVSHQFTAGVASDTVLTGFDPAHDQLTLTNADGTIASGAHSMLVFDVANHTLSWNPDTDGAAPKIIAAILNSDTFTVANLADGFRPEVFKTLAADGSSTIQWFDSDHSQSWDTLLATFDTHGRLTTYGSTADSGTQEVFHFDADNSQAYTRYVDELDPAGHISQRTVLYDDGTSWTAKFALSSNGEIVSYELDSFDPAGHRVGQSFFNADGTPLHEVPF